MIDLLLQKLSELKTREEKFNVAREYLQILILKILSDAQSFGGIAFVGGTALRIIYHVRRYSEDLDFSVISKSKYDFDRIIDALRRELMLQNIDVELKSKKGVIDSCMIHFMAVLQEAGIAAARDQKLSVKIEVDTNPPKGAKVIEAIINADFIFPVRQYDIPSLMAGKLHAVMFRKFSKGRDFYDLLWYLTQKIEPNLLLLENAIVQSTGTKVSLQSGLWIKMLTDVLFAVDFDKVRRDVAPFIIDQNEVALLNKKSLIGLLTAYGSKS